MLQCANRLQVYILLISTACWFARAWAAEPTRLVNARFDSKELLDGWELSVYQAQPHISRGTGRSPETGHSVVIESAAPSDAALGQELSLPAGRWFRFSSWVKTRDLRAQTGSVFGTIQVQYPHGQGVIASAPNHTGDTDWTRVSAYFKSPPDGRVRLCLFFAGFGTGTGTASFSDLALEEIQPSSSPVRILRQPAVAATISPLQYGQFIEYLCNLVPGMWAEKLYDGSFEGLTPYKFQFIKETDFKEKPWYPSGEVNRAEYSLDHAIKISGDVSKKISVSGGAPCTVGLSQDALFVDKGVPCIFNCWFKAEGLHGPVRLRLHHGLKEYAVAKFTPGTEWRKFTSRLVPNAQDDNATLSIEFAGPGTLWADNASLMPADTVGGWRPDVVQALRALKPGVIRFGGSALDDANLGQFEWKDTIGDPDRRKPFRAWGGLQPTGPGLEEIVQLCRAAAAEPLICVRINGRSPKDAADEVEYFNGAPSTPMGAWRARNGHAEPYAIKYWQIGNEQSGTSYEQRLPAFCQAMRAVDPKIKLLSSFPTPGVLQAAGEFLDFVCPHHYSHDLGWMNNDLAAIRDMLRANAPGRHIKVGVTEWNTTAGDAGPRRAMLWSLANALACSRYHNLLHRNCDLVEIANRSNLANSFCSGIIQTDNHRLFCTPTYYAQQLYAALAGNQPLQLDCTVPPDLGPDFSATMDPQRHTLTLFAVNESLEDMSRMVDFSGVGDVGRTASVWTLADTKRAGEPDAVNSFDEPNRIVPRRSHLRLVSNSFKYTFPKLSLTVLQVTCP